MQGSSENFSAPDFSFVVPVYNAAGSLEELCQRILSWTASIQKNCEILFVEDRGTDSSWEIIRRLSEKNPNCIRGFRLSRNYGQAAATRCGIANAKGKWVVTLDDDLQTPPEECGKLLSALERTKADIVYGIYPRKSHSLIRNLGSLFFRRIFNRLSGGVQIGSSFRLMKASLAEKIGKVSQSGPLLEEIIHGFTFSIYFTEVNHDIRKHGKSGYSLARLIKLAMKLLLFHTRLLPLLAFFTGCAAMAAGLVFLFRIPSSSYLFFCTGFLLIFISAIAEFSRKKSWSSEFLPAWSVEEEI